MLLGDYHYLFIDTYDVRLPCTFVVNVGCLMRMRNTPADREHEPAVAVYDTTTRLIEPFHMLTIRPADEVFAEATETEVESAPLLEEFLSELKATGQLGPSFLDNLQVVMKERRTKKAVRESAVLSETPDALRRFDSR